ncbi:LAQU0S08e00210g1_1 [Lachancea quebecensis]|uniref:LAQU0S08e00210g1_1 n=1 Tax=Lachancea quebecensis TaxID=1654605 RepID=A0A0P1KSA3_9SACH|nr:LAQU0S08e00210g1_1 [Lachancea quebecensis]
MFEGTDHSPLSTPQFGKCLLTRPLSTEEQWHRSNDLEHKVLSDQPLEKDGLLRQSAYSSGTYPRSFLDTYHDELSSDCSTSEMEFERDEGGKGNSSKMRNNEHPEATVVTFQKHYKMSLQLQPCEIEMVRCSWSILLDDECPKSKYDAFVESCVKRQGRKTSNNQLANKALYCTSKRPLTELKEIEDGPGISSFLFGAQFLHNIREIVPSIEYSFPGIQHAAAGVTGVLSMAISNLEDLSVMDSYLSSLGKHHARILGVGTDHFDVAGVAFLKTLRDRFGYHCTKELDELWSRIYIYLANSMLQYGIDPILLDSGFSNITLEFPQISERPDSINSAELCSKGSHSKRDNKETNISNISKSTMSSNEPTKKVSPISSGRLLSGTPTGRSSESNASFGQEGIKNKNYRKDSNRNLRSVRGAGAWDGSNQQLISSNENYVHYGASVRGGGGWKKASDRNAPEKDPRGKHLRAASDERSGSSAPSTNDRPSFSTPSSRTCAAFAGQTSNVSSREQLGTGGNPRIPTKAYSKANNAARSSGGVRGGGGFSGESGDCIVM